MSGLSGVNLRLISCDESISATISPNSDSVVWILALSAVNTSSWGSRDQRAKIIKF